MPPHTHKASPARLLALKVTRKVRERDSFASALVATDIDSASLPREERAFATLLTYGVVSCVGTLDEIINRNLNKPGDIKANVRDALRISTYELVYLEKSPYAVVDQGVELVRSFEPRASGFANAVLRKIVRDIVDFPWGDPQCDTAALARKHGYPVWLLERLIADRGWDFVRSMVEASDTPAPVFIATNPFCSTDEKLIATLRESNVAVQAFGVEGCFIASDARSIVQSRVLSAEEALVCDASAQVVVRLATPAASTPFLEVGSGRGTKTILLQGAAMRAHKKPAQLFALDIHEFKQDILIKRIAQAQVPEVETVCGDATALDTLTTLPKVFGGALIDAPCSGLGTLRRHPEKRWSLTPKDICDLTNLDFDMLCSIAARIEQGGFVVYATCTLTCEENEAVVSRFLASEAGALFEVESVVDYLPEEFANCITPEGYFLNIPRRDGADGHFAVKLVRTGR
jgi:16S rRNA (cytosine967-C5)-methyltransferase